MTKAMSAITDVIGRYTAGQMTRENLVSVLATFPYKTPKPDPDDDGCTWSGPSAIEPDTWRGMMVRASALPGNVLMDIANQRAKNAGVDASGNPL